MSRTKSSIIGSPCRFCGRPKSDWRHIRWCTRNPASPRYRSDLHQPDLAPRTLTPAPDPIQAVLAPVPAVLPSPRPNGGTTDDALVQECKRRTQAAEVEASQLPDPVGVIAHQIAAANHHAEYLTSEIAKLTDRKRELEVMILEMEDRRSRCHHQRRVLEQTIRELKAETQAVDPRPVDPTEPTEPTVPAESTEPTGRTRVEAR